MKIDFCPCPKPSGKKTSAVNRWANFREFLKRDFTRRDITQCEICKWEHENLSPMQLALDNLKKGFCLSFAHRHKRRWYLPFPELLRAFEQVLLVCQAHHSLIEYNSTLTELWFRRLRGPEKLDFLS
jgi:hypothetical protein